MSKIELNTSISDGGFSQINANFQLIEDELNQKVLYRNNPVGEPNSMNNTDLDMNGKKVFNLPEPTNLNEAARLQDVQNAISGATAANLISFTPSGTISSTTVQGAIQELDTDLAGFVEFTDLSASTGSTLVNYNPQVTNSVTRTLAAKLGDLVSVKDFGAKGDGVTDDFVAIKNARDYMLSLPRGGVLFFPDGTYLTSGRIDFLKTVDKRIVLLGYGATIARFGSYTGTLVYMGEPVNLTAVPTARVIGLTFAGPFTTPVVDTLVFLQNSNGTQFVDCQFQSGITGLTLTDSFSVKLHNCIFTNQRDFGIKVTTLSMQLLIDSCQLIDISPSTGGVALQFDISALNVTIRDSDFEGGNSAINFAGGGSDVRIDGCYFEGYTSVPVFFGGTMKAFTFESSWLGYNPGTQIWGNIQGGVIKGNIFENQNQTVDTTVFDLVIGNNDFRGTSNRIYSRLNPITLINGFTNVGAGWANASYIKDDQDMVSMAGMVTAGADNSCFVLPVGYRPLGQLQFATQGASRATATVKVFPDGNVTVFRSADNSADLSCVRFQAQS